ncbi:hypothetical protein F0562_027492 [Nyssa sinensis]|uniref:RanBD1 domain-containing protein n=1 Tax=Nyssa sinensis TaxID=561372 RepID=A0A5J5B5J2_9ASTE|nr:hypothetical protein F0562_027492 [Nyssa sinensis]
MFLSNSGCNLFSPVAYLGSNNNEVFEYNGDGGWDGGRGYGGRGRGGDETVVVVDGEEAMAVGICNKSWVVTMTMVDQGQHLLEAAYVVTGSSTIEDDVEQPSSPSVKKTEEKGVIVVHEVKCKLYVKSSDPADKDAWKDKGTGQLSIKCKEGISKGTKESKPTILVRNDFLHG